MDEYAHTLTPGRRTHTQAAATLGNNIINTSKPQQQSNNNNNNKLVDSACWGVLVETLSSPSLASFSSLPCFEIQFMYTLCVCVSVAAATQTTRSAYAAYGCWQRRWRQRRRLPILQLLLLVRLALPAFCLLPAPWSQSAVENCKFRKIDFLVVIFGYARILRVF